jgi:uncharacterized repeat protein (TIGR01451 family)
MKNLTLKHLALSWLMVFGFAAVAHGQADCSQRFGGTVGPISGTVTYQVGEFSHTTPTDLVWTNGLGVSSLTCRGCFPGDVHEGPRFSKGGSANVNNYSREMVIEFSQPVANLEWEINGAAKVTDNRGYTIHMPDRYHWYRAIFPGGGITRITISDPYVHDVYYPNGTLEAEGFWHIDSINVEWSLDSTYQQCNCGRPTIPSPPTQNINTAWPLVNGADPNWSMSMEMTSNDGLVLRDIKLGQRYVIEKINVPYLYLETSAFQKTRGELRPDGSDPSMRSRLVAFHTNTDDTKLVVEATYVIDQIPAGSQSCLEIIQRYEFHRTKAGDNCEPSSTLPCSRWKPIVKYRFTGANGEFLRSINIAQRQHRKVDGNAYNTVGLFRDPDTPGDVVQSGFDFVRKWNPLENEWGDQIIGGGKNLKKWDNIHQTFRGIIEEPSVGFSLTQPVFIDPGCPECIHSHWRWGSITSVLGTPESGGNLIGIPDGSNQDVDFGVVAYQSGEEHPLVPYNDLVNGLVQYWQPIRTRNTSGRDSLQVFRDSAPEAVVYWQSATGYLNTDTFFGYGGFFNPTLASQQLYTASSSSPARKNFASGFGDSAVTCSEDKISSVTATQVFAAGTTTVAPFDASLAGPLPQGYTQYGNLSYDVTTTAEASGPHTLTFCLPSVTDETTFGNLRIFHLEQDPYDPESVVWVNRTVLSPDPEAPDFTTKTINARANFLGQYVVGSLTQPQPPNTGVADISVTTADSPDGVVVGNDLTYTVTVTNNGPQNATGVVFSSSLSPQMRFVSVYSTQGNCKEADSTVVCKLDGIVAGNSATVNVVVNPAEDVVPFPPGGKVISTTAFAKANESDLNINNNSATENTTVLADSNTAPTVSITSPVTGALIVGPVNISVSATASDSDGSVSKVDFYGDGTLIGTSTAAPYSISWNNVSFGPHSLVAVATDDLNKTRPSEPVTVIVNGSANVSITSPANYATFNRSADIIVTANATLNGGTITKVDFYLDGFISLGSVSGPGPYSVTWTGASSGKHFLTAVATDNSNVTTTSAPVNVTVNEPPVISLTSPTPGTIFSPAPGTVAITAQASDWDGYISQVKFYANGNLIGTKSSHGVNQFNFTWSNVASGNYSITAVAVDSAGASTTSPAIPISVNAPPVVSISAPSSGAQFTAPASITITAIATDVDGSIGTVEFFANGNRVGNGTPIGGNQYSFIWSGAGIGAYTLSVKATDNNGASSSTNGPTVNVAVPVLFVTGSTTLNTSDAAVKARLEALNCVVTVKDAASAATADATGKALVLISSTVTPATVGTKFRTVTVPVITWESGLFNNMGMTGATNKDFGTKTNQTQISVTNSAHPLAAGRSGNVTVVSAARTFDWGKPNANAISVATLFGDATKTAIFAYESGAVMPGLTAPARRVGLFLYDDTAASFNSNGAALLDAAIRWARGGGSISGNTSFSPTGLIDLTNEGLIDWAHWGLTGPTSFNHKASATQSISNFTPIGTGTVGWFADNSTTCSWTDGTPTQIASNTANGINVNGAVGNGLQITVPADTNLRTLKLYVGAWYAQGRLEASLSDGSSPTYVDTSFNGNAGGTFGVYTINFKAGSPGQTMKIRFTILNQYFSPNGNLAWRAATLR